jgi:hypothetical protein
MIISFLRLPIDLKKGPTQLLYNTREPDDEAVSAYPDMRQININMMSPTTAW